MGTQPRLNASQPAEKPSAAHGTLSMRPALQTRKSPPTHASPSKGRVGSHASPRRQWVSASGSAQPGAELGPETTHCGAEPPMQAPPKRAQSVVTARPWAHVTARSPTHAGTHAGSATAVSPTHASKAAQPPPWAATHGKAERTAVDHADVASSDSTTATAWSPPQLWKMAEAAAVMSAVSDARSPLGAADEQLAASPTSSGDQRNACMFTAGLRRSSGSRGSGSPSSGTRCPAPGCASGPGHGHGGSPRRTRC